MARIEISDTLLARLGVLRDIVDDAPHTTETTQFTTDQGNLTASQVVLSTELTDSTLDIVLDINGDLLTFTSTTNQDITAAPSGTAEALYNLAEIMRAGAQQIKDIADTKFP